MKRAQETMRRIGMELIEERRGEVGVEMGAVRGGIRVDGGKTVLGRDLLSVLSAFSLFAV